MPKAHRNFYILVILAFMMSVFAALALFYEQRLLTEKSFTPHLLFPHLSDHLDEIAAIQIDIGRGLSAPKQILFVKKNGTDFFQIKQADDYFASQAMIKRLILGVAGLKAVAMKASNQEGHQRLGLLAPEKTSFAVRVRFFKKSSRGAHPYEPIISLLIGRRPDEIGDVLGLSAIYARREGEARSFLARGALPLKLRATDWLALDFLKNHLNDKKNGGEFITAKVQFSSPSRATWRMTRRHPENDFILTDRRSIPLIGIFDQKKIAKVADLVKNVDFLNVRNADDFNFRKPHIVIYESFSGLAVIFEIIRANSNFWARVNIRATSHKSQELARAMQNHFQGFAFLLSPNQVKGFALSPKALKIKRSQKRS